MKFTNEEIYIISESLLTAFEKEDNEYYIPAKINFLIQRNKNLLLEAAKDIEMVRLDIINKYCTKEKNEKVFMPKENIETVNQELSDLLSIEQNIPILKISFNDLDNIKFTSAQMKAIMFMINDDELMEEYEEDED